MFKKVLVVEDMDSINHAVGSLLAKLQITQADHAQYCDKAWLMVKKAVMQDEPYELVICDLSFKPDHREEKITSGYQLIPILKEEDPQLKVLVNSIEDHPQTVRELWEQEKVDAYVCKDRRGMEDLEEAILDIWQGRRYISESLKNSLNHSNLVMLNDFEVKLLTAIANGLTQDEIEQSFKKQQISPSSKSSIEKRLKELREEFNANTTPHLISIIKDLRLI